MGRDSKFICRTCKKDYYIGYGSYSGWCDSSQTVEEFDKLEDPKKSYASNQRFRKLLEEHQKHDFNISSSDWTSVNDKGQLCIDTYFDSEPWILDYPDYEHINLDHND